MKQNNTSTAILSPEMRRVIRDELRSIDECYYIIFMIITETGHPLSSLLERRAGDFKDRDAITVPGSKRYGEERQAPISKGLKSDLDAFLKDKSDTSYAFTSRFTGKKLAVGTYKKALQSVSRYHGIDPPVTVMSLVKTYVYDLYLKGDKSAFTRVPGGYNYEHLHEYLGLKTSLDGSAYLKDGSPKSFFYREGYLDSIRKKFQETVSAIRENTEHPDTADTEYIKKAIRFLEDVDAAIHQFTESV